MTDSELWDRATDSAISALKIIKKKKHRGKHLNDAHAMLRRASAALQELEARSRGLGGSAKRE